jgi:hypothetical protein
LQKTLTDAAEIFILTIRQRGLKEKGIDLTGFTAELREEFIPGSFSLSFDLKSCPFPFKLFSNSVHFGNALSANLPPQFLDCSACHPNLYSIYFQ